VAEHLERHGLALEPPGSRPLDAELARLTRRVTTGGREILEAETSSHWEFAFTPLRRALPDGWRLVKTAQQRGAIAAYLCEAGSDDGLDACGLLGELEPGDEFPAWRVHAIG
jgi:hypothetical protein